MAFLTATPKKLRWQFLYLAVVLAPIQASLAVTSSSVAVASSVKTKPTPAKPAAVVVTKAAPAKSLGPSVAAKPAVKTKPLTVASTKPSPKPNANLASQKSVRGDNTAPSTAVSQNKTVEP